VVSEYTGQTEYTFTLNTNGLYLRENDGSFYLADEKGVEKATIGDIIIFTADERNNTFGSMTAKTVTEGEKYELTIHIDADFLKDENTAYPIRIDPTVEISYDTEGAGAIEDITVNTADQLSATSGSLCLGKYGDDQSVSRIIMRFPGALFSEYPHPNLLISANVSLRDLIPNTSPTVVSCYSFNGNAWSEATGATWNGVGMNSSSALGVFQSSHSVSYGNGNAQPTAYRYEFDISKVAKLWLMGADDSKGLVFKASDTAEAGTAHVYKTFGSYNRASYKPVLTLNFRAVATTPPAVSNLDSEGNLIHCKVEDLVITADNTVSFWFTPTVTATYSLWTTGADYRDGVFINVFEHTVPLYCDMVGTTEDYSEGEDSGSLEEEDTQARSLTLELTATVTYCILIYDVDTPPTSDVDFHLVRGLPLSGSEIPYQPELWNTDEIQPNANCYAYALNLTSHPIGGYSVIGLHPGASEFFGIELSAYCDNGDLMVGYVVMDAENWDFQFIEVERNTICSPGTYKVALAIDPYEYEGDACDFHWYRQNPDGTWSHKMSDCVITNKDGDAGFPLSEQDDEEDFVIFDPDTADRDNGNCNYTEFIGYFQITPLSNFGVVTESVQ